MSDLPEAVKDPMWLGHWRQLAVTKLERAKPGVVSQRTADLRLKVALIDEIWRLRALGGVDE